MPGTPGVIIFDLDGTLADTVPGIANSVNYALAQFGLPEVDVDQVRRALGGGARKLWVSLLGAEHAGLLEKALTVFGPYYAGHSDWGTQLYPHVSETLTQLAASTQLAVATQKGRVATEQVLSLLGIADRFEVVVTIDDMAAPKPDPDCINQILTRLYLPREEAIVIGDMPYDVDTAVNAGVRCWTVSYGYGIDQLRGSSGYERMIDRFDELLDLIVNDDA